MQTEQSRYIQQNILGRGGYGVVYKAWDKQLEREVAIKIFHKNQAQITQEARILAQVNSPNVVTIHDILEWDSQQAIVMEYVNNALPLTFDTLKHFSYEDFINFLISTAKGIQAIHEKGIIHGDIKLSNMLIDPSRVVKLTDFGLAQLNYLSPNNEAQNESTTSSKTSGTWECLSPEQLKGDEITDKTDVFALGIILFSTIYGHHPFISNNDPAEARERLGKAINFNDYQLVDDQFIPLQSLCQSMLQFRANKRPSIHEVIDSLFQIQQRSSSTNADWSTETIDIDTPRKKFPWLLATALSLSVIFLASYYFLFPQPAIKTLVIPSLVLNQTDGSLSDDAQFDLTLLEKSKKLSVIINDELVDSVLSASKRILVPRREWQGNRNWSKVAENLVVDEILFSEVYCGSAKLCDIKIALYSKLDNKVKKMEELSIPADNLLVFAELVHSLSNKLIGIKKAEHITQNIDEASLQKYTYYRANIELIPADTIIEGLTKLRKENPGFSGITLQLGKVYLKQFDRTQDDTWLKKTKEVAEQISDSASGQELLFWYYLEANQFENALNVLEKLQQLPNIDYTYLVLRHTMLLFEQGENDKALNYLNNHDNIRKTGSYFYLKSYMLEILGNYKELLSIVKQWLIIDSNNVIAKEYLLIAYIHLGNMEQATKLGNSFQKDQITDAIRYNLSVAYLLNGDYNKSIEEFTKLKESTPNDKRILINLAEAQKGAGNIEASNQLYQTYIQEIKKLNNIQWKEMAYLALAYAHLGQPSNSLLALQDMSAKASSDKVSDSSAYYLLSSQIYVLLGQQDAALINGKKAIESGVGLHWYNFPWLFELRAKLENITSKTT
ncbi:serine/threonine-protein kinase [Aliikangiella coralliicola]|uniref:Protein kinase n=1 Tax=Aliikangiella coralliicola TaxID=2592383 RepID=A0A545UEZ0_9GAMM|nr:serine/threonine-protein kinase [Aliikangiella coralliicola]TQV88039.1 protein kinase [Aliikangiella coralliicola]